MNWSKSLVAPLCVGWLVPLWITVLCPWSKCHWFTYFHWQSWALEQVPRWQYRLNLLSHSTCMAHSILIQQMAFAWPFLMLMKFGLWIIRTCMTLLLMGIQPWMSRFEASALPLESVLEDLSCLLNILRRARDKHYFMYRIRVIVVHVNNHKDLVECALQTWSVACQHFIFQDTGEIPWKVSWNIPHLRPHFSYTSGVLKAVFAKETG